MARGNAFFVLGVLWLALAGCQSAEKTKEAEEIEEKRTLFQQKQLEADFANSVKILEGRTSILKKVQVFFYQMDQNVVEFKVVEDMPVNCTSIDGKRIYLSSKVFADLKKEEEFVLCVFRAKLFAEMKFPLENLETKVQVWNQMGEPVANLFQPGVEKDLYRDDFFGDQGVLSFTHDQEVQLATALIEKLYHHRYDPRVYLVFLEKKKKVSQDELQKIRSIQVRYPPLPEPKKDSKKYVEIRNEFRKNF